MLLIELHLHTCQLLIFCRLKASDYIQSDEHIQLAHDMAVQSIVLLKNDLKNGLPITSSKKKACVIH